jgi:hypothetical protein
MTTQDPTANRPSWATGLVGNSERAATNTAVLMAKARAGHPNAGPRAAGCSPDAATRSAK